MSVGFFDYPVLMAADILLYDTAEVPVGDDQRQHVELTRDIALRFNNRFGDMFVVPKATFPAVGARIMDLQDPTKKMSKSDDSPMGCVMVLDPPEDDREEDQVGGHRLRLRGAPRPRREARRVEPHRDLRRRDRPHDPRGRARVRGQPYGDLKKAVADAVVECLRPVQERFATLEADPAEVDRRLARGAEVAEAMAEPVLQRAMNAAGLLPRPR